MYKKSVLLSLLTVLTTIVPHTLHAADPDAYLIRKVASAPAGVAGDAHLAANPAQGFDAWIAADGVRIKSLGNDWEVRLELLRVGREGAMRQVEPAGVETKGARAELHRGGDRQPGSLVEWYVNDDRGLEQGFTLLEAPASRDDGPVVLELALGGDLVPHLAADGRRVNLLRPGSPLAVLVYDKLVVADAEGRELPARMEIIAGDAVGDDVLRIVVTDADAVYPLTVDPLLTSAAWSSTETEGTYEVAWGDWDGDGDLDLAVGNWGAASRVYENDGGVLVLAWSSTASDNTSSVAWGDWDGDGDLDLGVGNYGQPNRVYENVGGNLDTVPAWSSDETDETLSVAWGDWDGDGDLDLAAGNHEGYPNRVYENTDGDIDLAWTSTERDSTWSIAWGDWDGDGDLDLAAGNDGQPNRVYENTAGDLVVAWTSAETDYTWSIAWGDWDGDGDLDLAVGNFAQANRLFENVGGTLDTFPTWTSSDADQTYSVAWGDWDGDGDLDLAAGNLGQANRVYENTGNALDATSSWISADSDRTYSVAWGDWDGDGDLDLAAGNEIEPNRVYENTGHALASAWTSTEVDETNSVAWGDWDGDGDLDFAAGSSNGQANRVYKNTGGDLDLAWTSTETDDTLNIAWGDWDGDGDLDLAAGNFNGQPNRVYRNTHGNLGLAWTSTETDDTVDIAWGDWDGDGDLDLAAGNWNQPNRVYENTGGDFFLAWTSTEADDTQSIAWGDWDGDGDLDLAAGNYNTEPNRVYENTGRDLALAWTSTETDNTYCIAWGDWNGDGALDLAAGNYWAIRVYENTGSGLTLAWTSPESDENLSIAWGDWDGDGDLDLAAGRLDQHNRVYENTGGDLALAWTSTEAEYTYSIAWGDWDGDGDLDLADGSLGSNRIYENGVLNRPGRLPETPTTPVISQRPGTTAAAFFHSTAEHVRSPVSLHYTLVDEESDPARRVILEYSLTAGGSWHPATEHWSDGTTDLATSPQGEPHVFIWDAKADGVIRGENVVFRVTVPFQASTRLAGPIQRAAMSAVSPPFRVGGPAADLAVTKTDGKATATAGGNLTYTIEVTNHGPEHVIGARVTDFFPTEITAITWICDNSGGGACAKAAGSGDIDEIVDLPAGTSVTFTAECSVDLAASGRISNTATATLPAGLTEINSADNTATDDDWVEATGATVKTLILTHPDRMGLTAAEAESLTGTLLRLASHPQVLGQVVDLGDVPGSGNLAELYDSWGDDPGNPVKANAVLFAAGGVHEKVLELLAIYHHVEYLIVVGGDEVIPLARFADNTHEDFSESVYTNPDHELWGLSADATTVGQALTKNQYLSDDPLSSRRPLLPEDLNSDVRVFLPDLAVGRLLESVDDVARVVDAFIERGGVIDLTSLDQEDGHKVLVSGYHYLLGAGKGGRKVWKDALGDTTTSPHSTPVHDHLVSDYWDEADLLDGLCGHYEISNLNGHSTHWELGVPGYDPVVDFHGLETSDMVATGACGSEPLDLSGKLVFTADCHGGLPVASTEMVHESLDLSEAFASLGVSSYLANTGFGWGLRCGIGYSEMLVRMFSEELIAHGTITVGRAVSEAKTRYFDETPRLDDYDLKVLRQWRLTGIPSLELRLGTGQPKAVTASAARSADGVTVEHLGPVTVERRNVSRVPDAAVPNDMSLIDLHFDFTADGVYTKYNTSGDVVSGSCLASLPAEPDDRLECEGCYYTLNGLVEQTSGESDLPVQPYFAYDPHLSGVIQQGVLWKGGIYRQEEDWVPVFGTLSSEGEIESMNRVSLPRRIYIKPRHRRPPRRRKIGAATAEACPATGTPTETIVLTTAEIARDDAASDLSYSILKLHREVDMEVFYLPEPADDTVPCDRTGPVIAAPLDGEVYHRGVRDVLHWEVPVSDEASAVWRVVVVYDDNTLDAENNGRWQPLELIEESPGIWSGDLRMMGTSHVSYYLQAVDELGNVSWLLHDAPLPPSGIPLELPMLIDVEVASVSIPWVSGAEGLTVQVPVDLEPRDEQIAAVDFTLDYAETCLDPVVDGNGELVWNAGNLPPGSSALVDFHPEDPDGEIRVLIYGTDPLPSDAALFAVSFLVTCPAPPQTSLYVPVAFAPSVTATFGNIAGEDVPGSTVSGGVRIWPGPRGDCNGSGGLTSTDLTAISLEIIDGDGELWSDAPGGSFAGSPAGCDANASTLIKAADVACAEQLLIGRPCVEGEEGIPAPASPLVTVRSPAPESAGGLSWISVSLERGRRIGAVALSLDLDPSVYDLTGIAAHAGGFPGAARVPGAVRYPNAVPELAMLIVNVDDVDGELDIVLAYPSSTRLTKGVLVEIGVPVLVPGDPTTGLSVSTTPAPSFGTVDGADVFGEVVIVGGTTIFRDGFESGNTGAWSSRSP